MKDISANEQADVVIIGAGASGLMSAIAAAEKDAKVIICEQLDHAGAKLLVTGGGRCNMTNLISPERFAAAFGRQGRFIMPALQAMDCRQLREFFTSLGVSTKSHDGLHVYPASESAADVCNAMLARCDQLKVKILYRTCAEKLLTKDGQLQGLQCRYEQRHMTIETSAVIIATGGASYPTLGGTGGGYALARQAGHKIIPPLPALVPLVMKETWPGRCAGVSLHNVRIWIDLPGKQKQGVVGDVLFTHRGLSGPAVLDLSGQVAEILSDRKTVALRLELVPAIGGTAQWQRKFEYWRQYSGRKTIVFLLRKYLPASLVKVFCEQAGIECDTIAAEMPAGATKKLVELLMGLPLTVTATEGFDKAMVTRGGVTLREVDTRNLQSRLLPGLFFCGEILDLAGPCGGYNLQWAFSSGFLAGKSAVL